MDIALWILAGAAVLAGLAGVVLPLLPGTPLIFVGLWLAAWLDGYAKVSVAVVVVLGVLGVLGLVVDYVASALGVKRAGASGLAVWGAAIGALLGIFAGLPGLILGPIVGAIAGELLARRPFEQASRAGLAAGIGFLVAMAAKLGIAVAMLAVFAFATVCSRSHMSSERASPTQRRGTSAASECFDVMSRLPFVCLLTKTRKRGLGSRQGRLREQQTAAMTFSRGESAGRSQPWQQELPDDDFAAGTGS